MLFIVARPAISPNIGCLTVIGPLWLSIFSTTNSFFHWHLPAWIFIPLLVRNTWLHPGCGHTNMHLARASSWVFLPCYLTCNALVLLAYVCVHVSTYLQVLLDCSHPFGKSWDTRLPHHHIRWSRRHLRTLGCAGVHLQMRYLLCQPSNHVFEGWVRVPRWNTTEM